MAEEYTGEKLQGIRYSGKTVCKGIAMGKVVVLPRVQEQIRKMEIAHPEQEIERLGRAVKASGQQLAALYDRAMEEVGESGAAVFKAHQMMLEDEAYQNAICRMIRTQRVNAEYAAAAAGDDFAEMFSGMADEYMRARGADVKDVSARLVRNLSCMEGEPEGGVEGAFARFEGNLLCMEGEPEGGVEGAFAYSEKNLPCRDEMDFSAMEPSIIAAEDLKPSEIVQMGKKILAFVTVHGSANSHTAILARMMNIPALMGVPVDLDEIHTGMTAIVDGAAGEVIFEPTEAQCSEAEQKIAHEMEELGRLHGLKGRKSETGDGRTISICANIGSVDDAAYVLENDADGIGLFRSEFLYLGRDTFPSEEEQFQAYRQVVQMMGQKKVIIRTLDIGADKQPDYFQRADDFQRVDDFQRADYLQLGKENNPAMGCRAIRICLKRPEIFKAQLRALLRAAVYGNLAIMYPMIISAEEVERIHALVEEAAEELKRAGTEYRIPEQGIMIETPAAVIMSDELAELVDFFSIGTNDLTQFTFAIDRQNEQLEEFYPPHHKAILRMIQMVVDNAHKCGKWAGICGELGADMELTQTFVDMGVDELSVAPSMVLKLREKVRAM